VSSKRILIVDDEPHILEVIRVSLEDFGFDLMEVSDGENVTQTVLDARPDLILLDVMMPGKDGYTICRELKSDPQSAAIPIILLTAKSRPEEVEQGLSSGANAYVSKPFSPLSLLTVIHQHLSLGVVS
jgi:CheY-like chemotaxis protein